MIRIKIIKIRILLVQHLVIKTFKSLEVRYSMLTENIKALTYTINYDIDISHNAGK